VTPTRVEEPGPQARRQHYKGVTLLRQKSNKLRDLIPARLEIKVTLVGVDLGQGRARQIKRTIATSTQKQDAMTDTGRGPYLVALRPTWRKNLFWLLVVAIVLAAIFS
jgi:hypothetical protein